MATTTTDPPTHWARGHRALASEHVAGWLELGRDLLALEGQDLPGMNALLGRQDRLERHATCMQAVTEAARAEGRVQAEVAVLRREARPAMVAALEDLLAGLEASAPTAMPAAEAALMALVEQATMAAAGYESVRTLTQLARAEARLVDREARARAAGWIDEAAVAPLQARLDAALTGFVALERAKAATKARVAVLGYKQRYLDMRARRVQEDHGALLRELDQLLVEPDGRVPPGAAGVRIDDPDDLVLPD
jgi:hypothetical protein